MSLLASEIYPSQMGRKDGSSFLCRTVSFMVRVDLALLISWFQHVRPVFPPAAGFEGAREVSSD